MMRAFSKGSALVLVAAAWLTGCLREDVGHTLYVAPSDVTWSALEQNVRSDDPDPAVRLMEEQDYILAARAGHQPVARALAALGATQVATTRLRSERPFTVLTEGHFSDLAELARAILRHAGVSGDATVDRDGCRRTFRAWLDAGAEGRGTDDLDALVAEASSYRLVLAGGRFLAAEGFTLSEDGAVAAPVGDVAADNGLIKVSLTWSEGWCNEPPR
jgi:hypothetical protein